MARPLAPLFLLFYSIMDKNHNGGSARTVISSRVEYHDNSSPQLHRPLFLLSRQYHHQRHCSPS
ncbi:hypothetical protein N7471_009239 [Penicillium samsonianum]|uniref:uncharacterized protein n=1 Tax=Penicillium samsonianum TaxID=1882272 RepID=UPI002546788E|nr:uncharacterized protein N7471_009239 [Penicillium samsonianum]KAJ6128022.1 hypothetical protein N7471_009239 [Penicillium samsonianum]